MEKGEKGMQTGYNTRVVLETIAETWKLEARQESAELFYYVDEVRRIEKGEKCYVIGRKGMGKTAISEYFYNIKDPMVFSERLSFKNFPFNYLYSLRNDEYTVPNQYITIWKYVIFNAVCKMMARDNGIDTKISEILSTLYPEEPIKSLRKLVPKWTARGFGIEVLGCGGSIDGEMRDKESISWVDKADLFENLIEK